MKGLRKFNIIAMLLIPLLFSCSTEEGKVIEDNPGKAGLSFNAILQDMPSTMATTKQVAGSVPECSTAAPNTAVAVISQNGENLEPITLQILSDDLDGDGSEEFFSDYNEELELEPGDYVLEEFMVFDEDENLLWIAPKLGEVTGNLVSSIENPLPLTFNLAAGTKKYVEVEVLCYDNRMANEYGYTFFELIAGQKLYDLCFFANFCRDNVVYDANYSLELYYVREGEEDIQLYPKGNDTLTPITGVNDDGEYYADPLCVVIPGPRYGEADDEDYLYFKITLLDWPESYGEVVEGGFTREGYINWNLIEILRETDGNPETEDDDMRFLQFYINCNPTGADCTPTPEDEDGDCIPDALNRYGYLFYDLETTQLIDFCLFGNFCTPNGRHYVASYSIDVWKYENGERGIQLYDNLLSEVSMKEGDYAAEPLCVVLPDGAGEDEYYIEITIRSTEEYEVEEEVIRSGVITDAQVRSLFSGAQNVEYYHFFHGGCNQTDDLQWFDYTADR